MELQCSVTSLTILNPTFSWNFTKRGSNSPVQIVKENTQLSSDYSFRRLSSKSAILAIKSVRWIHDGVYTCIATGGGDIIQAESSLDVWSKFHYNQMFYKIYLLFYLQYPQIYTFKETAMLPVS